MKYLILLMIIVISFPYKVFAYDFEKSFHFLDDSYTLYFNITSENDSKNNTCEITYFDSEIVDGVVKYNQKNEHYKYHPFFCIPDYVDYEGKRYFITGIGDHAFQDSKVTYFFLERSQHVLRIGEECFKNCAMLEVVSIYCVTLTDIGARCFENCTSLDSIYFLGFTLEPIRIGEHAFHNCSALDMFAVEDYKPTDFKVEENSFDIKDGQIDCTLIISMSEYVPLYKIAAPWCYFADFKIESFIVPTDIPSSPLDDSNTKIKSFNLNGQTSIPGSQGLHIMNGQKAIIK